MTVIDHRDHRDHGQIAPERPQRPPAYFSVLIAYARRRGVLVTNDRRGHVTVSGPGERAPHHRDVGKKIDTETQCWVLGEVLARGVWVDATILPKSMWQLCREGNAFNEPTRLPVTELPSPQPAECPHPDKHQYPDRLTADVALTRILSCHARDRNHIPIRVYECRCGTWHLTSQPPRKAGQGAAPE